MPWKKNGTFVLDDELYRPDLTLAPAEQKKRDREIKRRLSKKFQKEQEAIERRVLGKNEEKIMKNSRGLSQATKIVVVTIVILITVAILIFLTSDSKVNRISSFVQAAGIIILAAITVFYAIQTRILAELQEKTLIDLIEKRNIDFLERSFDEFFSQFEEEYFPLRDAYKRKNFDDAERVNSNLRKFLIKNLYMMGKDRFTKITKFVRDLRSAAKVGNWEKVEDILKEREEEIKQLVIGEAVSIAAKIQDFHKQSR